MSKNDRTKNVKVWPLHMMIRQSSILNKIIFIIAMEHGYLFASYFNFFIQTKNKTGQQKSCFSRGTLGLKGLIAPSIRQKLF